jgi:hypothetical protein
MREQTNKVQTNRIGETGDSIMPGMKNNSYVHDPFFSAGNNNERQYDRT